MVHANTHSLKNTFDLNIILKVDHDNGWADACLSKVRLIQFIYSFSLFIAVYLFLIVPLEQFPLTCASSVKVSFISNQLRHESGSKKNEQQRGCFHKGAALKMGQIVNISSCSTRLNLLTKQDGILFILENKREQMERKNKKFSRKGFMNNFSKIKCIFQSLDTSKPLIRVVVSVFTQVR